MATFDDNTVGSDVSPSYEPQLTIANNVIKYSWEMAMNKD